MLTKNKLLHFIIVGTSILLIILILVVSSLNQRQKKTVTTKALTDQTTILTQNLNNKINAWKNASGLAKASSEVELETAAYLRKNQLLKDISTNPQKLFLNAISPSTRDILPQRVKDQIEATETITADFSQSHLDNFKDKKAEYFYTARYLGKSFIVYFNSNPKIDNTRVYRITGKGLRLENNLVFDSAGSTSSYKYTVSGPIYQVQTTGEKEIAIILVEFSNSESQDRVVSFDDVEKLYWTGDLTVNGFFVENSKGKTSLKGEIYDYVRISADNKDCQDRGYINWGDLALIELKKQKKSISPAATKIFIFAKTDCFQGKEGTHIASNNTIYVYRNQYELGVNIHELGHSYGLGHSNYYDCGDASYLSNCLVKEYADWYDTMGWNFGYFNIPHITKLNWLDPGDVTSVFSKGFYTVKGISSFNLQRGLAVYKDNNLHYYIEYRTPNGYDSLTSPSAFDGVLIHTSDQTATNIIDPNPLSDAVDERLTDGAIFYDKVNNITIRQVSHNANSAQVEILYTTLTPTLTPTPSKNLTPPKTPTPTLSKKPTKTPTPTKKPTKTPTPTPCNARLYPCPQ
ncbi:hypothetical protein HY612_05845 [Candidatus Roizmanbacteria bacterium]|nr:hypothetical protein [Candidatus Roizmanbacteria bacterium]